MRTIREKTDHVVIVGAGLAGLATAMHLAGAGRKVTLLEKEKTPGGRNGLLTSSGYSFDTGPTVLTMPSLIQEAFSAIDENMEDWLHLKPVSPLYRSFFADGSILNVFADTHQMEQEISQVIGTQEAIGYRRYVDFVTKLYKYEMKDFIDRNIDSPFGLLTPNLAKLIAIGGFRRLAPKVNEFLKDPRTQRVYSFQAMYAGLSPQQALAIYAVIAYMDSVNGVYFPEGGMHAVPRAMAAAAIRHGVDIRYEHEVTSLEKSGSKVTAAITSNGERFECDAIVLNPDLPIAWTNLLGKNPWSISRLKYSPSCVVLLAGSSRDYEHTAHHNIHFGHEWEGVFTDLIQKKTVMSDPSILVTVPTKDDASLAPAGKHSYYVLFPTPNLDAKIDWQTFSGEYQSQMIEALEKRGYTGFGESIEISHLTTPLEWERMGLERGAPFASSHTFLQTGPFRPSNFPRKFSNVVFAGSGTRPGVGVPMVLISGKLAAQRITGK